MTIALIAFGFVLFVFALSIVRSGKQIKDNDDKPDENETGTQELFYHGVENELL